MTTSEEARLLAGLNIIKINATCIKYKWRLKQMINFYISLLNFTAWFNGTIYCCN